MTFYAVRSKDSDAAGSNFMAAQLLGNASLQVDLHVSFGRCFRRFGNGKFLGSATTIVKNTKVYSKHIKMIATMFTSETQVNLRVSKSSTSIHLESTTNGLARPTDLPLADQSLTSMLRAKCWRMPWHVGRRSSKGLVMAWRRWLNPLRW